MTNRWRRVLMVGILLCLFLIFLSIGLAPAYADPSGPAGRLQRVPPSVDGAAIQRHPRALTTLEDDGPRYIFLRMRGAPLARVYANREAPAAGLMSAELQRSYVQRLAVAQQRVVASVEALGVPVVGAYQKVLNGVQVKARPSEFDALLALPGVESIHPVALMKPLLGDSVPHIGAQRVIDELGIDGTGVDVGIIDTGIDYIHADFGGPATEDAYAANDNTTIDDTYEGDPLFPTDKVVGGWDFVGEPYDAGCSEEDEAAGKCTSTPQPDPDPMDENGHGTHVAGIAAGIGTENVPHGVAPGARLWTLKIFGRQGSTSVTADAIEWAVDPNNDGDISDALDVINMSLGAPFSNGAAGEEYSAEAMAIENAIEAGVTVVAAAGNSGDVPFIVGAPAAISPVISVASSYPPGEVRPALRVTAPASIAGVYEIQMANFGPSLEEVDSITDDVAYAEPATACEDVVNAGQLNGQIALIDRGDCTFVTKVRNAQQAGAVAVIIVDDGRGLVGMADDGSGSDITIPSVMVSQGDGARIKGALPGVRVTLRSDIEVQRSDLTDQISSFSSRGPGWRRSTGEVSPDDSPLIFKPEVTAPGSNILSAKWASGTQGVSFSGTSMAAPHVAGVAALVKRAHPGWEPGQIKSALLTTARPEIYVDGNPAFGGGGTLAPATRMGAGLVDALAATNSDVFIFGGEGSAVDFGFQIASEPTTLTREVTLRNDGDSDGTYEIDFAFLDADDADAGVSIHASSEQITVPAGGSATVEITADIDPAILKAWSLRGSATGSSEALRDIEYDGWLTFTPVGTAVDQPARGLHVPVYLLVRRSADIAVEPSSVSVEDFGVDHSASLQLTNVSPVAGVAEVFTLVGQDVDEGGTSGAVDVRAAGVRSTAVAGLGNVLEFAFATHAPRVHPAQIELDVFIDVDRDGTADYVLFNGDLGILSGQQASGVNVTVLFDRETNEASLEFYTDTDLLTTNINLPVVAEHMGLGDDDLAFDFWVSAFDNLSGYLTDVVPERAFETPARFTFDGARPLYVIDRPSVDVVDAQRIEFFVDPRGALAQPSAAGLLILYDSSITNVAWDAVEVDFEYELHDLAITAGEAVTGFVYSSDVNGASLGGSPMWTGRTDKDVRWYGVTQFDLASQLPDNAHALKASLGLTGLEARYLDDEADASWVVELLDTSIDSIWPAVTYYAVDRADVAAQLGPVARDEELVEGEVNVFQFDPDQVSLLSQRAATTGRVSLRTNMALDRLSQFVARHLFAWDGGRGTSVSSERPPVLHIKYVVAKR